MRTVKRFTSSLVFCLVCLLGISISQAQEYEHEIKDKNISFSWKVGKDLLAVKLVAKTQGWVGIGFNPSKKMKDANYILGYVKKGTAKITDEFGHKGNAHKSDKKLGGTSDVTLVSGSEENGMTTIEFTIPLQSEDKHDVAIDVAGETVVLLAYGAKRDSFKAKHKYRSTYGVNLTSGEFEKK